LATALDIDLAAAFGVTDLFFPGRTRFICIFSDYIASSICLAYGDVNGLQSPMPKIDILNSGED